MSGFLLNDPTILYFILFVQLSDSQLVSDWSVKSAQSISKAVALDGSRFCALDKTVVRSWDVDNKFHTTKVNIQLYI